MKTLIKNGLLVDPANQVNEVTDLYLAKTRVAGIGQAPPKFVPDEVIDATGKLVMPGIVDLSARVGEPGFEYKASVDTEAYAAISSGIAHLCCPPDTRPALDSPADIEFMEQRQEEVGLAHIHVIAALTKGLKGEKLSEMASLKSAGCVGVSNAQKPFANINVIRRALEYAASHELTVFINPELQELADCGCAHEGAVSTRLGLPPIPEAAETAAIGLYLPLIEQSGARVHFMRLSTAKGMNMVRRAKYDGLPVTADVCAHQLFLTELDLVDFNPLCHTRPPLRSQRDKDILRKSLSQHGIDAICSDHHPHESDAKLAPFQSTEPGISALETLLPLVLRLVEEEVITLSRAVELLSTQPAKILNIDAGKLGLGDKADLCIVDLDAEWECKPNKLLSQGKNSPFGGWLFKGQVSHCFIGGRKLFSRERL